MMMWRYNRYHAEKKDEQKKRTRTVPEMETFESEVVEDSVGSGLDIGYEGDFLQHWKPFR
jgi:hypothetical protein